MSELLIGCGSNRDKRLKDPLHDEGWVDLTTLDNNLDHDPDVFWDLRGTPWPFPDDEFDEVHAYEVLEHLGQQGDYKALFSQFSEVWRVLKPDGKLYATVPWWQSNWAWGDPSHTRVIQPETLVFLDQKQYTEQVGVTPMSDFRYLYKADLSTVNAWRVGDTFCFILRAIKPSRLSYDRPTG